MSAWNISNPPQDGTTIVAIGRVIRGSFKTPVCWGLFLVCLNGKAGGTSVFHA